MRAAILAMAAVACGGEASPDSVCDHMIAVAKKSGAPMRKGVDLHARCVSEMKQVKDEFGDEAFGKFAACMRGKNDIASMATCDPKKLAAGDDSPGGGFDEYARKSKSIEAKVSLKRLHRSALEAGLEERAEPGSLQTAAPALPEPSAGPTPPLGTCCKGDKGRCAPDPSLWAGPPWTQLLFSMDDPHYYSYEYKVDPAARTFTVSAYGDLDCDGTYSTFSMSGKLDGAASDDPLANVAELKSEKELE
jgi:hypothetical protein